jgi:hypothetical protein
MTRSCSAAMMTAGWQQLQLATALREADSPAISRSFDVLLRACDHERERAPSNAVDCRRRVREERAGREELAARVAEVRRKVAEAGLDPAIVDEAVEAARRSA